ncbi:hypothetical protein [Chitinimonas sp. BJYL2]|uniref:hypothetical protein n=1 Tax=Chitinimonas sp. BJYL2 TaxID=2976696 RepID=UPI0022B38745|nr:hypothetical protein [Chitinimonas sp. BJYL2]
MRNTACLALLLCLIWPVSAATIVAPTDVIRDYQSMVGTTPPELYELRRNAYSRRDAVELLLTCQALRLGGYTAPIRFVAIDPYPRRLAELQTGRATLTGNTSWLADLQGRPLDVSPALIESGQFEAALFTAPDNHRALRSQTLADIQQLSAVSHRTWTADWQVLQSLRLARLDAAPQWVSMVRMVASKRTDFLLAPFQPSEDGSLSEEGRRLVPISGIKLVLPGSRHLAISRTAPDASAARQALEKGLALMHASKLISRAYQVSGFFLPQGDRRVRINP